MSETKMKQQVYSYKIKLDVKQDAWNWYFGCNRISKGVDWKQRVPIEIYKNIFGKPEEDAYKFIIPFLKQKYIEDKEQIDKFTKYINYEYEQKFIKACEKLVKTLNKPLYRNDFTIFLTTFPRGPYDYSHGYIWKYIGSNDPIRNLLHELLHFQFIHYWKIPGSEVSLLNDEQFDWLNESLTVILDEDFHPIIEKSDQGYEIHQKYRQELHKFWKINHDFNKLVDFGLKILPDFVK